jgi:hypothetical protein
MNNGGDVLLVSERISPKSRLCANKQRSPRRHEQRNNVDASRADIRLHKLDREAGLLRPHTTLNDGVRLWLSRGKNNLPRLPTREPSLCPSGAHEEARDACHAELGAS